MGHTIHVVTMNIRDIPHKEVAIQKHIKDYGDHLGASPDTKSA